jgi:hypothetical protein
VSDLDLSPRLEDADAFYARLVDAIDAADETEGVRILMRLALILANQLGDQALLEAAIAHAARKEGAPEP